MGGFGRALVAAILVALAAASCGLGENHDPYALLDKAWSTGWDRVQVQLGGTLDTADTGGDFMPIPQHIQLDPGAVSAIIDTRSSQWRLSISIPQQGAGLETLVMGLLGPQFQSIDAEVLFDGSNIYAKSALLSILIQPGGPLSMPVGADLNGWVRLGSTEDLQAFTGAGNPLGLFLFGGALPQLPALSLPTQGDPATLRQFFEDLGVVAEYKGTEQRNGRDAHHVAAGLDFEKLARSQRVGGLLGAGPDQLNGLSDTGRQVAIGVELWFDKETSRLVGFQLNVQTLQGQTTKGNLVLNLMEPSVDNPFDPPATFTDVPLTELSGGNGSGGGDGSGGADGSGGGVTFATPAPMMP